MASARFTASVLTLAILVLSAGGCREASNKIAIRGQVSYRGERIPNGAITFFPAAGRPVTAPISPGGDYTLELPPGEYDVVVNVGVDLPPGFEEGDSLPPPKIALPAEYTTRARSTLKATVGEENQQPINFELK